MSKRIQRVQTQAGVRKYGVPIGTIITADVRKAAATLPSKNKRGRLPAAKDLPSISLKPRQSVDTNLTVTKKPRAQADKGLFAKPKSVKVPKPPVERPLSKKEQAKADTEFKKKHGEQATLNLGGSLTQYLDRNRMKDALKTHYALATDEQKEWGTEWYDTANQFIKNVAEKTGISEQRVAGVFAAFSPQTAWDANTAAATHFLLHYDPDDPDAMNTTNFPGLGDNLARAKRILQTKDTSKAILDTLGSPETAPKIRNFYQNLMGNKNAVTIDTWMAKAMFGKDDKLLTPEEGQQGLGLTGAYDLMADVMRETAKELGVHPRDLQAIVWTQVISSVNKTSDYSVWSHESYQAALKKRDKAWTRTPFEKPLPDYTHEPGWNAINSETQQPHKPVPRPSAARNVGRGPGAGSNQLLRTGYTAVAKSRKKRNLKQAHKKVKASLKSKGGES